MGTDRVTVSCPECGLQETFGALPGARAFMERHREGTGHEPDWQIHGLSTGVEQAGADAGVCGSDACANEESPLFHPDL